MTDPAQADMIVALFSDALERSVDTAGPPWTGVMPRKEAELLRDWSARYPDLRTDFAAVAVDHWANAVVGGQRPVLGEDVPTDHAWIADQVERVRRATSEPSQAPIPDHQPPATDHSYAPAGLRTAALSRGIGFPDELAARLRLPPVMLERLAGRQFDPASVPVVLIQQLAALLQAQRQDIAQWLAGPAAMGYAGMPAAMVSESRAQYGTALRFSDAVTERADWDDADRGYWQSVLRFSRLSEEMGGLGDDEL